MPLNRAADAMRLVRDGNMHVKLPEPPDMLEETHLIYHTFNQMTAEIERLKIDIYEERLKRQRAALQFLQLQNKPHFFSNALQLIKAMAEKGDYARIGHIVDLIAKYMRYSLPARATSYLCWTNCVTLKTMWNWFNIARGRVVCSWISRLTRIACT